MKLITHLHLVPRSRMRGSIHPLPQHALMSWCPDKAQGQLHIFTVSSKGKLIIRVNYFFGQRVRDHVKGYAMFGDERKYCGVQMWEGEGWGVEWNCVDKPVLFSNARQTGCSVRIVADAAEVCVCVRVHACGQTCLGCRGAINLMPVRFSLDLTILTVS
jgi:hypothetical protein